MKKMIKLGIENLNDHLNIFENKNVGLITNHTGIDQNMKSTIDLLKEKTNLVALFAPEHGVRGDIEAGVKVDSYVDSKTNLKVFSLYGETRKPTKEMLENIDVLCFDIQDVGVRFYTYIYTMAYSMIAAKENNIKFVVFDRPNPLGGEQIEGNILDLKYRSFVGYYPLVQRYGLTVGELAIMFNKEYNINANLYVVEMSGWKRNMLFTDTKLDWILPSPNLPTFRSVFSYLATCYFEGTNVSEGRGTTKPFETFGAPWLKNQELINILKNENHDGVKFRETYFTPNSSKHKGKLCNGVEIIVSDEKKFKPVLLGMSLLVNIKKLHDEFQYLGPYSKKGEPMINLLVGDNFIKENKYSVNEIKEKFYKDETKFKKIKEKYYIYG